MGLHTCQMSVSRISEGQVSDTMCDSLDALRLKRVFRVLKLLYKTYGECKAVLHGFQTFLFLVAVGKRAELRGSARSFETLYCHISDRGGSVLFRCFFVL